MLSAIKMELHGEGGFMDYFSFTKTLRVGALGVSLMATAGSLAAADLSIEEVIVTGTKRATSQQDLGIAVTTLTSDRIANTFTTDMTALTELAPNVTITKQTGFNAVAGGIRGTGNISILVTNDASVGLIVDDFALNHVQSQFVELFDIEQIEVFRGPQGTLFGKNTSAGAINITTKKPVMNEFTGTLEVSMSEYSSNSSNASKVNFAINVPLMDDTLSARLAIIADDSDGYYSNSKPSKPVTPVGASEDYAAVDGGDEYLGGVDVLAGKLKFLWEPTENYQALAMFEFVDDKSGAPAAANETPEGEGYIWPGMGFPGIGNADPFVTGESSTCDVAICVDDGHQIEVEGFYLTQALMFGDFTLKSITGMRKTEEVLNSTYTGEAWTSLYDASRNTKRKMLQQEFRLASDFDGPFNFVAGAAYYEDDLEFLVFGRFGFLNPAPGSLFQKLTQIQNTFQDRKSSGFYLDATYEISDKTSVAAGLRHSKDKKTFRRLDGGGGASGGLSNFMPSLDGYSGPFTNPLAASEFGMDARNSAEWDANTWRLLVEHDVADTLMVYGSVSKGFQAGGFAETCASIPTCLPYKPEESQSIELGLKGDFFDGTLRVNAAVFDVDYEDVLRSQVTNLVDASGNDFQETRVINGGETNASGVEVEVTWLPTDNFRIDANIATLDHDFKSFSPTFSAADMVPLGGPADAPGRDLDLTSLPVPFSPELNFGISMTYDHLLESGGRLSYNLGMHYQDEFETQPYPANGKGVDSQGNYILETKENTQSEDRTLVNGYIRYSDVDEAFNVTLYGKNLTDEVHRINANAVATLWNFTQYGAPREIGIKLGYNF